VYSHSLLLGSSGGVLSVHPYRELSLGVCLGGSHLPTC
jgi:hypothetical protein